MAQRLLGRSSPTTTKRCGHLSPDFLVGEMALLDFSPPRSAKAASLASARGRRDLAA